ncbi:NAD(P)/FAD-dependent oxidoreductase [Sporosarcina sp. FSL K6-1522]|uniref:NAD(P)/FAD-dependent oxidoreductase n=1 Tax=Sporosarcina sp. FSL K6-1522 TaxID=2921554 RepID=UPI00315AA42B
MLLDCAIIGGGPAGLNAALVVARSGRKVILFDEDKPRNAVTQESHGFITRDGITPAEFKKVAQLDLMKYPNIAVHKQRVIDIQKVDEMFHIWSMDGSSYQAKKVILSTGLTDIMPQITGIHDFYGTSLFSCPFCDGWELKNRAVVVISEEPRAFHMAKMMYNWSQDLVVCTNGKSILSPEQKELFTRKNITVIEDEILHLEGDRGHLTKIRFKNGQEIARDGGLVTTSLQQAAPFAQTLGCTLNKMGSIETDILGRTNIAGVYASGDNSNSLSQVIIAAAEGSKAAIGVISDMINEEFEN